MTTCNDDADDQEKKWADHQDDENALKAIDFHAEAYAHP